MTYTLSHLTLSYHEAKSRVVIKPARLELFKL